jgi:hypothetical protein
MSQFIQGIATSREYIDHVDVMNQGRSWEGVEGLDKRLISQYIKKAQETVRGEHQLEEYVARLGMTECQVSLGRPGGPTLSGCGKETTVSASVLVAYATLYGSTQEVAEAVATALRKRGLEVGIQLMRVNFGEDHFSYHSYHNKEVSGHG